MFTPAEAASCRRLVEWALEEDLGPSGDLTSRAVIAADLQGRAAVRSRAQGVVAGLRAAEMVFAALGPTVRFEAVRRDGDAVEPGDCLARVGGPMRAILGGERTALNFLQRLSGIASRTRRYVEAVTGFPVRILDTRKTTPGWRLLEKYAVRCGGGTNHRMGLFDAVLIKDNHLAALGPGPDVVRQAVQAARVLAGAAVPVTVEVDALEQMEAALGCGPDVVLLDNMPPDVDEHPPPQAARPKVPFFAGLHDVS